MQFVPECACSSNRKGHAVWPEYAMSYINSTCRKSLGGKCPYDIALTYMSAETLQSLGIKKITPSEANLTPSLLK